MPVYGTRRGFGTRIGWALFFLRCQRRICSKLSSFHAPKRQEYDYSVNSLVCRAAADNAASSFGGDASINTHQDPLKLQHFGSLGQKHGATENGADDCCGDPTFWQGQVVLGVANMGSHYATDANR